MVGGGGVNLGPLTLGPYLSEGPPSDWDPDQLTEMYCSQQNNYLIKCWYSNIVYWKFIEFKKAQIWMGMFKYCTVFVNININHLNKNETHIQSPKN